MSSCAHLADYTVWNVADEGRRLLAEGCRLNNINDYQLPRDRKGVSGETAGQRADEWKDEGEKGPFADRPSEEEVEGVTAAAR